jgi:hypothetical protein
MNGNERQGDANPIASREKLRKVTQQQLADLRVQSQVHVAIFASPPLPLLVGGQREQRKQRNGRCRPARRVVSMTRSATSGSPPDERRPRSTPAAACSRGAEAVLGEEGRRRPTVWREPMRKGDGVKAPALQPDGDDDGDAGLVRPDTAVWCLPSCRARPMRRQGEGLLPLGGHARAHLRRQCGGGDWEGEAGRR